MSCIVEEYAGRLFEDLFDGFWIFLAKICEKNKKNILDVLDGHCFLSYMLSQIATASPFFLFLLVPLFEDRDLSYSLGYTRVYYQIAVTG